MIALVMLLAVLLSVQVRVATPGREVRVAWTRYLLYQWELFRRRVEIQKAREQARLDAVYKKYPFAKAPYRKVTFNENGGFSTGPVWYAKPKNQRILLAMVIIFANLLMFVFMGTSPFPIPFLAGAVINSQATGNWNVGGTWAGGAAPGTGDDAVILNTHIVTVTANQTTGSVECQAGGTLAFSASEVLTCDGESAAGYAINLDGVLNANTGKFKVTTGAATMIDIVSENNVYDLEIAVTDFQVDWEGNTTIDHDLTITSGTFLSAGGSTLTVTNYTIITGTLTCAAQAISLGSALTIANPAVVISGTLNGGAGAHTYGSIGVVPGGTWIATSGVTTFNGLEDTTNFAVEVDVAATFTHSSGTVTFTYDAGFQYIDFGTDPTYNLIVNHAACICTLGGPRAHTNANLLTVTAGTFDTNSGENNALTVAAQTLINGGTLTCNASTCQFGAPAYVAGEGLKITSGTFTGGSGTHSMSALRPWSGTCTMTSGTATITGVGPSSYMFVINDATFAHANGTIVITRPGVGIWYSHVDNPFNLYNVTCNHASLSIIQYTSASGHTYNITIANNFTVTAGTFSTLNNNGAVSCPLTVTGACDITGTLTGNASAISVGWMNVYAGGTYSATSGTTTLTSNSSSQALVVNASGTFTHNNGTVDAAAATNQYILKSGGTIALYNLTKSGGGGKAFLSTSTVGGNISVTSGELSGYIGTDTWTISGDVTVADGAKWHYGAMGAFTHTVTGNVNIAGYFKGWGGTCTFGSLTITATGTCIATSGTTTITSETAGGYCFDQVSGSTFTHNNGTIAFTYAGYTVIRMATYTTVPLYNVVINHASLNFNSANGLNIDGNVTVTNCTAWNTQGWVVDIAGNMTVTLGTVSPYNNSITVGGNLTINGGTCNTIGTGRYIVIGNVSVTGTLDCDLGSSAMSFGTLLINSGGTYLATAGVTTITGTDAGWGFRAVSGSTFTHSNGTVTITYGGGDTHCNFDGGSLYNFIVNKASGSAIMRTALTVANNLTITAGILNTYAAGNYALTVTGLTSVSGTLTCNASTISLGSGITNNYGLYLASGGATFTGGSGTHTMGGISGWGGTNTITLSSGTTTLNGTNSNAAVIAFGTGTTFNHSNGTVVFTYAGQQLLCGQGNVARTFYNLTVNNASCLLQQFNTLGFALTVANNFTITTGTFNTSENVTGASRNLTVTGAATVAGTLTGNASTISLGWLVLTGTYTATSATTTITSESAGGYAWDDDGTFTHSNGTVTFTYAGTTLIDASGTFYNLTCNHASLVLTMDTAMTVANNLTITAGQLTTSGSNYSLTVTGATSITGTLTCNSSTVDMDGALTINGGGVLAAPSSSGAFYFGGTNWTNNGTFTHSSGTVTFDRSGYQNLNSALTFYNITKTSAGNYVIVLANITIESTWNAANAGYGILINCTAAARTITIGTGAASGRVTGTIAPFSFSGNTTNAATIVAASSAYPIRFDTTDMDWDGGGAGSLVTLQDCTYLPNATIGTATASVTATRVRFSGTLTVTNATVTGTMCVIDASTTTVSSGLYIEGWYDPTETARGGWDWILIGGAYTIASNKTYSSRRNFYKLGGATLTIDTSVSLVCLDPTVDGTWVTAEADLVDTNNGTFDLYYTVDLFLEDIAGSGVDAAAVVLYDQFGAVRASDTTSSGDITAMTPIYARYSTSDIAYYPYTLSITKAGYGPITMKLSHPHPLDLVLVMGAGSGGSSSGVLAWAKETVALYPYSSVNDSGEVSYGTPVNILARVVRKRIRLPSNTGQEVYSTAQLYVAASVTVTVNDKVVLPDTNTAYVLAFSPIIDARGTTIAKVIYL